MSKTMIWGILIGLILVLLHSVVPIVVPGWSPPLAPYGHGMITLALAGLVATSEPAQ